MVAMAMADSVWLLRLSARSEACSRKRQTQKHSRNRKSLRFMDSSTGFHSGERSGLSHAARKKWRHRGRGCCRCCRCGGCINISRLDIGRRPGPIHSSSIRSLNAGRQGLMVVVGDAVLEEIAAAMVVHLFGEFAELVDAADGLEGQRRVGIEFLEGEEERHFVLGNLAAVFLAGAP